MSDPNESFKPSVENPDPPDPNKKNPDPTETTENRN